MLDLLIGIFITLFGFYFLFTTLIEDFTKEKKGEFWLQIISNNYDWHWKFSQKKLSTTKHTHQCGLSGHTVGMQTVMHN